MTLGEFRRYTNHLIDDIELKFFCNGESFIINSMNPKGNNCIEFVTDNYEENPIEGCLRVASFCKGNPLNMK